MKKVALYSLLIVASFTFQLVNAQVSEKEKRKLEKEEKKKQKEAAELADFNKSKQMAETKQFVITADELNTSRGIVQVDPKINFLIVNGEDATFQFAFYQLQSIPNPNGLGGITSEGKVTKYTYTANNPKKPVSVELTVKPQAAQGSGVHNFVVTIFGEGYAELIMPGGSTRLRGKIVSPEDSRIIKGGSY